MPSPEELILANRFQKFIYHLSAEAPVLFVFAIVWLIQKNSWMIPLILVGSGFFLIIIFTLFFKKAKSSLSILDVEGVEYKCVDGWLIGYVTTYLIPFISLILGDVSWIVLGVLLLIILSVLVFSDYVTPHPVLFFMRYHFYELKVEGLASDYKVISKKQIRNAKDIRRVSRIFEFLLIRMG